MRFVLVDSDFLELIRDEPDSDQCTDILSYQERFMRTFGSYASSVGMDIAQLTFYYNGYEVEQYYTPFMLKMEVVQCNKILVTSQSLGK